VDGPRVGSARAPFEYARPSVRRRSGRHVTRGPVGRNARSPEESLLLFRTLRAPRVNRAAFLGSNRLRREL